MENINVPQLNGNNFLKGQMREEIGEIPAVSMLTDEEEEFCQLFCNGGLDFVGKQMECYKSVFKERDDRKAMIKANELLVSPHINKRVTEIYEKNMQNNMFLKQRVINSLVKIMDETREANYKDRWGIDLSPAPLRAVSVNAASKIADICGWKKDEGNGANINIGKESNVTFNVIVPQSNHK